jgi:hypothetical protein
MTSAKEMLLLTRCLLLFDRLTVQLFNSRKGTAFQPICCWFTHICYQHCLPFSIHLLLLLLLPLLHLLLSLAGYHASHDASVAAAAAAGYCYQPSHRSGQAHDTTA